MLERHGKSAETLRLVVRTEGAHQSTKVFVGLPSDLRAVRAAPVGKRHARWVVKPSSTRRRSLLARMAEAIKSEESVLGVAAIDDDPHIPDPAEGFTLVAFNDRVPISRVPGHAISGRSHTDRGWSLSGTHPLSAP